ncbi:protein PAXX isoform X1 [Echeneis naucrates]|uniref:protein PAXX isoform X1 n=1 Tax=Echeneis naucrates TaxID=173247 RepID=UPI0011140276|nr:protein PAXX isoform X1 [Echeneis naucrates]
MWSLDGMDADRLSVCAVVDKKSHAKFLCYTHRKNGLFSICLTDVAEVWSVEYNEATLNQFKQRFALKSTDDYLLKLRSACGRGDVSVELHESMAELQMGDGPGDRTVTLSKLKCPEATEELRELLFRMADSLTQLDNTPLPVSPVKNPHTYSTTFCAPEYEPRQQQNSSLSVTLKRRPPGTSLINPGTKKKLSATGVAFEDAEED